MDSKLFQGISDEELNILLDEHGAKTVLCEKNQVLIHQGDCVKNIYVCLEGAFNLESVNLYGEISLISHIPKGGYFGGAFAFSSTPSPADFRAISSAKVLIIPTEKLINKKRLSESEIRLIRNLTVILANKSTFLITKIQHLTGRSIREKVLSYLTYESSVQEKDFIEIPFNRQELADYLAVDRSALSKELSLMKSNGLIDYQKNKFLLKYKI